MNQLIDAPLPAQGLQFSPFPGSNFPVATVVVDSWLSFTKPGQPYPSFAHVLQCTPAAPHAPYATAYEVLFNQIPMGATILFASGPAPTNYLFALSFNTMGGMQTCEVLTVRWSP